MRKFNLYSEIIVVDKDELIKAKDSQIEFVIDIDGVIKTKPYSKSTPLIYKGIGSKNMPLKDLFDSGYTVNEKDTTVELRAFHAWGDLIALNRDTATYDDTSADGIDGFPTEDMEKIAWHSTEFDIDYRELVEVLEKECDGVLFHIEVEDPYRFSGLGFIPDLYDAYQKLYAYTQAKIKDMIENDEDYEASMLSSDELEAAKYFKAIE
ncbi:MAG: hypothetical protein WC144_04135 [Sulfurimonas sp.]|jgi:hypothetical protein|nr:hypothetical protein [Sulfurimonadaceae bacterium]